MDTGHNGSYDQKWFFFPHQKNNSGMDQDVQNAHTISGLENTQLDKALSKLGPIEPTLNISWEGICYLVQI